VFEELWPLEEEVSVQGLTHTTETVVLMSNGRRFGEVVVPRPPASLLSLEKEGEGVPPTVRDWYIEEAFEKTEEGRKCWGKYGDQAKKIIVVRMTGEKRGIVINLAVQKKRKTKKL
jgi:hypothetical protein